MKVLFLSNANSVHTIRWVRGLCDQGVDVGLWSISKPRAGLYEDLSNVEVFHTSIEQERFSLLAKIKYLTLLSHLKKTIKEFKPDIVHAQYASSFGLLGALVGFKPYIVSVWGSDVYDFPNQNFLFRKIIKFNLKKADKILSTSHVMAKETTKYTSKKIKVIPFGIDMDVFENENNRDSKVFTVGTVKTLEEKYGIAYLMEAFVIFHEKYPEVNKRLLIVGGGSLKAQLEKKSKDLRIDDICVFVGRVPYTEVPRYHNKFDVCCCLSILDSESFGVAAIESSAVENPVIVSNVGGLPEVIEDMVTGLIVPPKNSSAAAEAIEKLYLNKRLREDMGKNGRKRVKNLYDWKDNLTQMKSVYNDILATQ